MFNNEFENSSKEPAEIEELIKLSEKFLQEAFKANCYYDIIKQYSVNVKKYKDEMETSSAFYTYTYKALIVATYMELAKIYDNHKKSINIKKMMDKYENYILQLPQLQEINESVDNEKINSEIAYTHTISDGEKEFFKDKIKVKKQINELFCVTNSPVEVDITSKEQFEFYKWQYKELESKISNLHKQRNKIFAHNDEESLNNINIVIDQFPLTKVDIELLISFASNLCQFVVSILTGIYKVNKPININDWQGTLDLTRLGYKYIKAENDIQVKEFEQEYFPEKD